MESALREENAALKECLRSFSAVTPVKAAGPASPSEASPGLENGHGEAGECFDPRKLWVLILT